MKDGPIVVIGAGGAVGFAVVEALRALGAAVSATYRTERPGLSARLAGIGAAPRRLDLSDEPAVRDALTGAGAAIFTPILTTAAPAAHALPPQARAIFFSSNNVAIDPDAPVYAALKQAEDAVRDAAPSALILRPTMIFGYPGDGNLSRLMGVMKRTPVTPLIGKGLSMQQPVYYRDVAEAAARLIMAPDWSPGVRAIAGPDAVSQKALYRAAGAAISAKTTLISLPRGPMLAAARFGRRLRVRLPLSPAQIARADHDKGPQGPDAIITATPLDHALKSLAAALDATGAGA